MEKSEIEPASFTRRKKNEPTFVPEWLKTNGGISVSSSGSVNHISGSTLHLDDHQAGKVSRNRLSVNSTDRDNPHSFVFTDRSSLSYRRSSSANGSLSHDKDSSAHSRPYSSFGRSHRERDREKEIDFHDKEKWTNLENGTHDFPDSLLSNRSEKDTLKRSQSMISGRRSNLWAKRSGSDTSSGSIANGIGKSSFDREFPSLGAEDKQGLPEIGRVSSPGLSSVVQSLPLCSSAIIGGNGWTSALAEVPAIIGSNGSPLSCVQQITPAITTNVPSTAGLNMAEKLAQAPLRSCASPKLSVDTQRLEELAIKKSRQLIPVTPSTPKTSVLNSSEKLKPKGARASDLSAKTGQSSSAQLVNHIFHGSSRSDVSKASQGGNFQVLNREKSGISPTARDGPSPATAPKNFNTLCRDAPSPTNAPKVLNSPGAVPIVANASPLKSPNYPKPNGKATSLPVTILTEKRPVSQQNRSDFFNSLRKKTSASHSAATPGSSSYQSPILDKSDEQLLGTSISVDTQIKGTYVSDSGLDCSMDNGTGTSGMLDSSDDPANFSPSNGEKSSSLDPAEEERLLRLFGWKENAGEEEEALTAEEIDAFIKEYEKLRPSSRFCRRNLPLVKTILPETGGGTSGLS